MRPTILLLALPSVACGQPVLFNLGVHPGYEQSSPSDVSRDGSVVVGYCRGDAAGMNAFRWTVGTAGIGLQDLGRLPGALWSRAKGVSADGAVVVGESQNLPFRWTSAGGMEALPTLPGTTSAYALAADSDGSVIVGYIRRPFIGRRAVRWINAGPPEDLGDLPGAMGSTAVDVSADGQTVVGWSEAGISLRRGFIWTESSGMIELGFPGEESTQPVAVSGDGLVVVGFCRTAVFRWTKSGGFQNLGIPPSTTVPDARDVNEDGATIVGGYAFWTRERGTADLFGFLQSQGVSLADWSWLSAFSVSPDGTAIVGEGYLTGNGLRRRAWLVAGFPRSCYADCNTDTTLTVADFGCFQSRFVEGDPYADCNGDGQLTVFDFGCFQTAFVAGCP